MERLRNRFLNKSLRDVPKTVLRVDAQKITDVQKAAANNAPLVEELADTPIDVLDLSAQTWRALKHAGINSVGDILDFLEKGENSAISIRKFSEKSLDELRDKIRKKDFMKDDNN